MATFRYAGSGENRGTTSKTDAKRYPVSYTFRKARDTSHGEKCDPSQAPHPSTDDSAWLTVLRSDGGNRFKYTHTHTHTHTLLQGCGHICFFDFGRKYYGKGKQSVHTHTRTHTLFFFIIIIFF